MASGKDVFLELHPILICSLFPQAMFPHLQHRQTRTSTSHEDKRLFCLAASDFYSSLTDPLQREKFVQTFQEVAEPGSPYSDLLATIQQRKKISLQSRQ